jgi:hypothetical protein
MSFKSNDDNTQSSSHPRNISSGLSGNSGPTNRANAGDGKPFTKSNFNRNSHTNWEDREVREDREGGRNVGISAGGGGGGGGGPIERSSGGKKEFSRAMAEDNWRNRAPSFSENEEDRDNRDRDRDKERERDHRGSNDNEERTLKGDNEKDNPTNNEYTKKEWRNGVSDNQNRESW